MSTKLATVTTKGQLVIPSRLRKKYSIRAGTKVAFIDEGNRIVLQPITDGFISSLRGSIKAKPSTLALLLKTRREERDR